MEKDDQGDQDDMPGCAGGRSEVLRGTTRYYLGRASNRAMVFATFLARSRSSPSTTGCMNPKTRARAPTDWAKASISSSAKRWLLENRRRRSAMILVRWRSEFFLIRAATLESRRARG